jgi:hypothetical protein
MVDKNMKIAELYLKKIGKIHGKKVQGAFQNIIFRCRQAEADVEQLSSVIMNERAIRKEVGMYCITKTKDKIVITRQKRVR